MKDLHNLATALGIRIEYADLTHLDRDGDSNIDTRTIRLQTGMLQRLERSVLAHEIAHIIRGDRHTMFGYYDKRDERRADEWAALHLIDLIEYQIAEAKFGNNIEYIAQELNVMDWVVEAFERMLLRVGNEIYIRSKMGAGQWLNRFEVA